MDTQNLTLDQIERRIELLDESIQDLEQMQADVQDHIDEFEQNGKAPDWLHKTFEEVSKSIELAEDQKTACEELTG